ncbi:hypothetical protein V8J88_23550 [Massilia sp. W12]|uniref:hypothetical protein n=1 Tax=Massilia sp. W12 TaxID=3126507 RepID=UPI0030CC2210
MQVIKHMEALFLASAALFCAAAYEAPASLPTAEVAMSQNVQTVVIVGHRDAA